MRLSLLHEKPVPRCNLNKAYYPVDVPATVTLVPPSMNQRYHRQSASSAAWSGNLPQFDPSITKWGRQLAPLSCVAPQAPRLPLPASLPGLLNRRTVPYSRPGEGTRGPPGPLVPPAPLAPAPLAPLAVALAGTAPPMLASMGRVRAFWRTTSPLSNLCSWSRTPPPTPLSKVRCLFAAPSPPPGPYGA